MATARVARFRRIVIELVKNVLHRQFRLRRGQDALRSGASRGLKSNYGENGRMRSLDRLHIDPSCACSPQRRSNPLGGSAWPCPASRRLRQNLMIRLTSTWGSGAQCSKLLACSGSSDHQTSEGMTPPRWAAQTSPGAQPHWHGP